MAITYRGGFAIVRIFKEGQEFNRETYPILFNSIASVRAKVMAGQLARLTIELTPSFSDGIDILKSGIIGGFGSPGLKPDPSGNDMTAASSSSASGGAAAASGGVSATFLPSSIPYIAVKFMYPDDTDASGDVVETAWYTGMIIPPSLSIGNGEISITIEATAQPTLLGALEGVVQFKNVSVLDAIKQLVKPLALEVVFDEDDTETESALSSAMISGIFNEPRLETIRNLLFKNKCEYAFSDGDKDNPQSQLRIRQSKSLSNAKIDYTFVMFRQINPDENIVPIFDFSLDSPGALFIRGAPFGTFTKSLNTKTKESKSVTVDANDYEGTSMSGGDSIAGGIPQDSGDAADVGGATGVVDSSDQDLAGSSPPILEKDEDTDNKAELKGALMKAGNTFLKFTLTCPGLHMVKPMTVGQIIIGDNIPGLSGPVLITGVEHVWDSNGWSTTVEVRQTGSVTAASGVASFSNKPLEDKPVVSTGVKPTAQAI